MKKIIFSLRKQPEEFRRGVLYILMLAVIVVMVVLWIANLENDFTSPETRARIKRDLEPFSALRDNLIKETD